MPAGGDGDFRATGAGGGCAALRHGNASPLRRYDSQPTSLQSPLNFVFAFRRKLRSLPCISSSQCARSAGPHREPCMAANRAASSKRARFIRHWRRFAHFPHFLFRQEKKTGRARSKRKTLLGVQLCPLGTKLDDGSWWLDVPLNPEIFCRVRRTGYRGRGASPHLWAWMQIWGGRRKDFSNKPRCRYLVPSSQRQRE